MVATTPYDVVMIGPFPSDADRIAGGVQASLYGLARELVAAPEIAGLRVVATPGRPFVGIRRATVAGIDVTFIDAPHRFLVSSLRRLPEVMAVIAEAKRPVVHLHGTGIVQAAVLLACRRRRLPVVWTMHGITEKEMREARRRHGGLKDWLRWALYTACERLQLKLSPRIVVDTGYVVREVAARAAVTPLAIPQGIFLDELAGAAATERREPLVLALGVVHPRKGHDLTIRAFAEVAKVVPEARLLIIGSLAEPWYLDRLHEVVAETGLSDRVEIRTDAARAEVLEALARARVFALHSQEESQGIALCEAMAVGLPIVVTRVGGIPDVIGASGGGFLVEYGDVDAMARHLVRLLGDDDLRRRTGEAARRRAADFAWSAVAARVMAVYRAALG